MAEIINQSNLNKARLDKFLLSFSVPACLKTSESRKERGTHHKSHTRVIPDSMQYSVYGALVPEISVPSTDLPYAGQHLKVSTHARDEYDDVSVDFNVDNEFNNYWYIWRWLDVLNDHKSSIYDEHDVGTSNPLGVKEQFMMDDNFTGTPHGRRPIARDLEPDVLKDYATTFSLFGLNEYNKPVIEFTYINAFPTNLGEISYSYQDEAEIKSSFTYSFSQLHINLL